MKPSGAQFVSKKPHRHNKIYNPFLTLNILVEQRYNAWEQYWESNVLLDDTKMIHMFQKEIPNNNDDNERNGTQLHITETRK